MNKDLSKVRAGDFVRSPYENMEIGLVVVGKNQELQCIFSNTWCCITPEYDYRRLKNETFSSYIPKNWARSWQNAESIFQDEIDITVKVNGRTVPLSEISDKTLINIKNNS